MQTQRLVIVNRYCFQNLPSDMVLVYTESQRDFKIPTCTQESSTKIRDRNEPDLEYESISLVIV